MFVIRKKIVASYNEINLFTRIREMSNQASSSMIAEVLSQLELPVTQNVIDGVFDGKKWGASGSIYNAVSPTTGEILARVRFGDVNDYERCVTHAKAAQSTWQQLPAPKRGDIVRQIGDSLRVKKEALGILLSLEMGKIKSEGCGEVQEYIDVCDLATGLSRQLPGQVLPSERHKHTMLEVWHPLGMIGIITAFNFPHAVCGWNSAISMVCGNVQVLKGAESASLITIATQKIITEVLLKNNIDPAVAVLCQGTGIDIGELMIKDERVNLVSFTGSTQVGRHVNEAVCKRFGRPILELGGNNAIIVMPSCDQDIAIRSVLFAAVGTCGQRCTSLRRLILHSDIHDSFVSRLVSLYNTLPYGDPLDSNTVVGPLHTQGGVVVFENTIKDALEQGGKLLCGGYRVPPSELPNHCIRGNFVKPAIISIDSNAPIVQQERFVPILYISKTRSLDEAIKTNNQVKQGLSSSLFSHDMREVFQWTMSPNGSDTGIVNVNTSCSGAEIGGAFGGNKHTGDGRESGSDSWKQYMRRTTICINYGDNIPLAQGITF